MQEKLKITYYEIVLLWVGIVSALIVLMLCIGKFSPSIVLIGGIAIVVAILGGIKIYPQKDSKLNVLVLLMLLIALLLRSGIITHYMGGQDQGLYVNMSATMTRSGSVVFTDRLRESLSDVMKEKYDTTPEAGVGSVDDPENSVYSIDFYPMHSAWMACSTFLFGLGKHTISLLFFSLLGLIGIYLLTMELTGNDKKAGYIALLFGTVNPALVFFSKFPVGEMVALCFSVNAFYLLNRAFSCNDKHLRRFFLLNSALLFSAFCYTRMTFPLLFSILLIVLCITFLFNQYSYLRKDISFYIGSLVVLFSLSWVFYYKFQFELAHTMYTLVFKSIIDKLGIFTLFGIFGLLVLIYTVSFTKYKKQIYDIVESITKWLENNALLLLCGGFILSIFSIIKLCKEGLKNYGNVTIEPYLLIFRFHSLYRYMLFVSPVLLFVIFIMAIIKLKLKRIQILLLFFLTLSWIAILMQTPYILYLYYYGRYLVSEMVPYSLILFGIIISALYNKSGWRQVSIVLVCITAIYFTVFSIVQINNPESENPYVLYKLDNIIDKNDVIIYENSTPKLSTPLRLFFDKQVYIMNGVKKPEERCAEINYFFDNGVQNSGTKYGNIFLLEHTPLYLGQDRDAIILYGKFEYSSGSLISGYEYSAPLNGIEAWKTLLLPLQYETKNIPIYLYKINKRLEPIRISLDSININFEQGGNSGLFELTGISDQEETLRWTVGEKAVISTEISRPEKKISKCQLKINAGAYTGGKPKQRFGLVINGSLIGWENITEGEFIFDIPVNLVEKADKLTIELLTPDAHSPKSTGQSGDSRVLGLRLKRIQFMVTYAQ